MSDHELNNIQFQATNRHGDLENREVTNSGKAHLRVWKAFIHYRDSINQAIFNEDDILAIQPREFLTFRRHVYPTKYTNGPIPPGPDENWKSLKSTEAENFQRGIKRDPSLFPELKKDTGYKNWKRETIAVARSQGCINVFDSAYHPLTVQQRDLFQLQKEYMYSVFIKTLLTDKGRELVRFHEVDADAQEVFRLLDQFYTTNVVGQDQQFKTLHYITSARLGDGTWNGTTHAFILHFQEQIRAYHSYVKPTELLSEPLQLILLQNAVDGVPALSQVKTTQQQLHVTQGTEITYHQYCQLLSTAALTLDKQKSTSGSTTRRQRRVYYTDTGHEIFPESYNIDTPLEDLSSTIPYDVYETVRIPSDRWSNISQEGKQAWIKMSQADRASILGLPPPKVSSATGKPSNPSRKIHLTQLSVADFDLLLQPSPPIDETSINQHESQQPSTPDTSSTALTVPTSNQDALVPRENLASVPPSDLRRMLGANQHEAMARSPGGGTPGVINVNGHEYRLSINQHECNVQYKVSLSQRVTTPGSLMDGGANGGCSGDDVRVINYHPTRRIDITGAMNHQTTDIRCATVGAVTNSNMGPIILVMHQYAHTGKGATIHAKGQWQYYGAKIDDTSMVVGGTQTVRLAGGIIIPLDIVNGLPRMPLRPYTDKEWDTLPIIHATIDKDWNPRVLDHVITDNEAWYDAQQEPTDIPIPGFDEHGNPIQPETFEATVTYSDLQENLPAHLGPLSEFTPSPELMLTDNDSSDDSSIEDTIDSHVDFLAYEHYLEQHHAFETELMKSLEPEDLIEFTYHDAIQSDDDSIDGDVYCFNHHTHRRMAFPTTRSQSRSRNQTPRAPPQNGEPNLIPPDDGADTKEHGEPSPSSYTHGESHLIPPEPDDPQVDEPEAGSTAPSARPPGKPLEVQDSKRDYNILRPLFGWLQPSIIKKTIENTTQLARIPHSEIIKSHYKSPHPALNIPRRDEDLASDTIFSDTPAVDGGQTMAQAYIGCTTHSYHVYPMQREKDFLHTLQDCVVEHGAPNRLLTDNAQAEKSQKVHDYLRTMLIGRWFSEAHKQFQNPMERGIQQLKMRVNIIMDRTGAPAYAWLLCLLYTCYLLNHSFNATINGIPFTKLKGSTTDSSALLRFHFYEEVYYQVDDSGFPSDSKEAIGHMVGISEHVGHRLTYKVLTKDTKRVIHRSELRSTKSAHNKRLDLLSGEDLVGGQKIKTFVRSNGEDNSDTTYTEEAEQDKKPVAKLIDLIGKTFLMDKQEDGTQHRARIHELVEGHERDLDKHPERVKFKVSINNDQYEELLTYQQVLDHILKDENTEVVWKYKQIVGVEGPLKPNHPSYNGSNYNVLVEWEDGSTSAVPLNLLAADDPVACAIYAKENNLLEQPGWKRFKSIARRHKKFIRMVNQAKLRSYRSAPKYMFGYQIPRDYKEAVKLDELNGNTKWQDCTRLEMQQLFEYNTFEDLGIANSTPVPNGYKKIRVHLVYAVKHDGRHKARLVADGHLTDIPLESVYSGVVSLKGFRLVLFLAELNGMEVWATDIGNAYLEARTKEKLVIVAGSEFGELQGHLLRIHKALYGLRTSGLRWHERFSGVLTELGFFRCKTETDIWMRPNGDVYEYIAVYVDDLALVMKNPKGFVALLEEKYGFKFKGTGHIQYHLGMNFERDPDGTLRYIATKYIEKLIASYERMFGEKPTRRVRSPLEPGDHPELDTSEFLDPEGVQLYQSLIGSLQWLITIGRLDIQVAVMTLSSFRSAPRRGHLDRAKRVVSYVYQFNEGCIRIRTGIPDFSEYPDHQYDWMQTIYTGAQEMLPHDAPPPLGKPVMTTSYVDANLMHDMLTGRSVTGVLHFVNQTPFDWYAKKQSTVETATYGSEMVAARTAVEQIIEHRNTLRYLGVKVMQHSYLFGDNESVVNGASTPQAKLNKRHNFLSFHRTRESIAAGFIKFFHMRGTSNPADILSKHWAHQAVWPQLQPLMFFRGDVRKLLLPKYFKKN